MDFVLSTGIFVVVFVTGLIFFSSRRNGDANQAQELMRRMTPLPEDGEADAGIMRRARKPEQGKLLGFLYRTSLLRRLEQAIWQAGLYIRTSEMLLIIVLMFFAGFAGGQLFWNDSLFATGTGSALGILPLVYLRFRRSRRLKAFGQQLPYALDLLKSSLEAGHSLLRGMQVAANEFSDPLGGEFRTVVEQTRIGLPLPRALSELVKRVPQEDLRLLVVAVKVQSEIGSSLAQIIGRLTEIIRTRQRLRLQVRAMTAQSRFGGMVVGLMPVIVLAIFSLIQPDYTNELFHDPTGIKILKAAIVMDLMALLTIRRLLRPVY